MNKVLCREVKSGQKVEVLASELGFRVSAYGITFKEESVLLVQQWDGYDIPGGGIDLGETTEAAIKREVFEETGITVTPLTDTVLLMFEDFVIHPVNHKPYHWFTAYYACMSPQGELSETPFVEGDADYAKPAKWVPLSELGNIKFYNAVRDNAALIRKAWELVQETTK